MIELMWPDKRLNPNARVHRMELARVKKTARHAAWGMTMATKGVVPTDKVRMTFYAPDSRHRDADNMLASMKGALDGVFDALDVDDKTVREITIVRADPEKPNGRVVLEFV